MKTSITRFLLLSLLAFGLNGIALAQSSDTSVQVLDSLTTDSPLIGQSAIKQYTLIDTLKNDSFINSKFRGYANINNHITISDNYVQREVPSIKEVQLRKPGASPWLFWIIAAILAYIGGVRTFNQKNFRASLNSVFSMKITSQMWEERGVIFNYITIQLFSIFVLICALFSYVLLINAQITFLDGALLMYLALVGIIFLVYAAKFMLHYLWGWLFQLNRFGISMVSNIVTTNNFIALMVLPVLIALIYINFPLMENILTKTIAATFILSVVYRVARSLILSGSYFRYPIIYIILYLCIFEISPWIIIVNLISE